MDPADREGGDLGADGDGEGPAAPGDVDGVGGGSPLDLNDPVNELGGEKTPWLQGFDGWEDR